MAATPAWRFVIYPGPYQAMITTNSILAIRQKAAQVEAYAKRYAPKDTGRLSNNIKTTITARGTRPVARIGSDLPYAYFQHEGTGIYGVKGQRIRPKHGKYLVFRSRSGELVFAKSVSGVKPTRFLYRAMQQAIR